MYKCQETGETIGPRVPQNRIVIERRRKIYENKIRKGKNKGQVELIEGWEIVKEIIVGPDTYKERTGLEPARSTRPSKLQQDTIVKNTKPVRRKKTWSSTREISHPSRSTKKSKPVVEKVSLPIPTSQKK